MRTVLLFAAAAAALAHGGGGADASVGVAQLDEAGLAALVATAGRTRTAAVVRFYMNSWSWWQKVQPAFTAVAAAASESGALFGEVECRAQPALCQVHGAGAGGWPTVKTFSAAAPGGAAFPREASGMVCEELRSDGRLTRHVAAAVAAARAGAEL